MSRFVVRCRGIRCVMVLNAVGLTALAAVVGTLTIAQINQVVDQIGSALCDAVQTVACLFTSVFSFSRRDLALQPEGDLGVSIRAGYTASGNQFLALGFGSTRGSAPQFRKGRL